MNLNNVQVKINKPYPEIVDALEDKQTVAILKNLAMGRPGEVAAANQYVYQSVIADKTNDEIACVFEEIGIVEMMHLDMLMHAIADFGGNPEYRDAQGNFFNTASLNYTNKLKEMLENNIKAETLAIENYQIAIDRVQNQSLKDLFARIIEDEKRHVEIFKQIRDNVEFLSI